MGHSIDSTLYRLPHRKHWRGSLPPLPPRANPLPLPTPLLDGYLQRFLLRWFPHLSYSHCRYLRRRGEGLLLAFVHSDLPPLLHRFLRRRARRRGFSLRLAELFLRRQPQRVALPLSAVPPSLCLNRLWATSFRDRLYGAVGTLCGHHLRHSRLPALWEKAAPTLPFPTGLLLLPAMGRLPTPLLLSRVIGRKLRSGRHRLRRLFGAQVGPQGFGRYGSSGLLGLVLEGRGRFSRTQRAASLRLAAGTVPFSTIGARVEFGSTTVHLKYGACTIRVWFHLAP